MRALVTGGAGFIGSHLCDRLSAEGHEVIVLDDFSSGSRENLAGAKSVRVIEGSILELDRWRRELAGVDRIYHLAALISGHDSLLEPERYHEVNVTGLLRVIELAKSLGGARIVFASSSTVYGNSDASPLKRETDVPAPITVYALTKLVGEHLLSMYGQLYGFGWTALRLFNVYGPRQSPTHPYANVTCKFAHAAAVGAPVKLYGDGAQSRDFVYVDDVVDAFMALGEGGPHSVYNVGTGKDTSIRTLLSTIESLAGRALEVERCDPWPNDIRAIRASVERMQAAIAAEPRVPLEEGLARTLAFFRRATR